MYYCCCVYRHYSKPSRSAQRNQNMKTAFAFMKEVEQLPLADIGKAQLYIIVGWC